MTKTVITKYVCNVCDGDATNGAGIRWDDCARGVRLAGHLVSLPDSDRHVCPQCLTVIADDWRRMCMESGKGNR